MQFENLLEKVAIWAIPVLFAITVHEAAHGWVAYQFGDRTAFFRGRLTLNPIKHIDPVGTILLPLLCMLTTNFIFGWAKPVPIDDRNLAHPRRDLAIIAAAGPLSNFIMALIWGLIMKLNFYLLGAQWIVNHLFLLMAEAGVLINLVLCILNFIPIPPLDGSKVIMPFLSPKLRYFYIQMESMGFIILMLLMFSGLLGALINPAIHYMVNLIMKLYGIS